MLGEPAFHEVLKFSKIRNCWALTQHIDHFIFWIPGRGVKGVLLVKIMQIFQKLEKLQHLNQFSSQAFLDKGYSSSVGLLCVMLLIGRYDCI